MCELHRKGGWQRTLQPNGICGRKSQPDAAQDCAATIKRGADLSSGSHNVYVRMDAIARAYGLLRRICLYVFTNVILPPQQNVELESSSCHQDSLLVRPGLKPSEILWQLIVEEYSVATCTLYCNRRHLICTAILQYTYS